MEKNKKTTTTTKWTRRNSNNAIINRGQEKNVAAQIGGNKKNKK